MNTKNTLLTLLTFALFVILFYALGYWLIFRMGQATPLMLSVGMATIATCIVRGIRLDSLGWHWGDWRHQWASYIIPLLMTLVAYLVIWLMGFGEFYNQEFLTKLKANYNLDAWNDPRIFLFHMVLVASISFFVSLPSILGEEVGWRGLLLKELSKLMPFTGVALVSGFAWSLFHWPLIIKGLYGNEVTPLAYKLFFFTLFIVSTSVIMTYYRMKSGSLWTAVIYHASSNIYIQKVFTPITRENADSAWYIDEFGAVLALTACCVALYFGRKGRLEFSTRRRQTDG